MTDHTTFSDRVSTGAPPPSSAEVELARERALGGAGIEEQRDIPRIDLADHDRRRDEIDEQLWRAATEIGFFQLVNHGIDRSVIDDAFARTERFFALPTEVKAGWTLPAGTNSGWEHRSQVRPSTGTVDEKESYQITRSRMDQLGLWPDDEVLPGFRAAMEDFERRNRELAMTVLGSFARRLGFDDDFFDDRHDPSSPTYQSTLRLLHYLPLAGDTGRGDEDERWRAGAHTDFDCLTLLHQLPGQHGLQVCPGADAAVAAGRELRWTPVPPDAEVITCNIGDMLVRWSDDALRSTLHRVRMPRPGEYAGPRYSLAYFAQADTDAVIQGPGGRYGPITAGDYLRQRIEANFAGS